MIVNKLGAAIFTYASEFRDMMQDKGIEDPWSKEMRIRAKAFEEKMVTFKNGQEIKAQGRRPYTPEEIAQLPTQEEKDSWRAQERRYIAEHICKEVGYKEFVEYAQNNQCEDLLDEFFPCNAPEGQCNFFCKQYNKGGTCL